MKKITEFSKESLDGKFVFVTFKSDFRRRGIAQLHFEGEEIHNANIHQNFISGGESGLNKRFEYGWNVTGDEEFYELPEVILKKLQEKQVELEALVEGDVVLFRNRWREIEIQNRGKIYAGGEKMTIMDDWIKRPSEGHMTKKEAMKILYKPLLDHPGLDPNSKRTIEDHIRAEVFYTNDVIINDYVFTVTSRGTLLDANPKSKYENPWSDLFVGTMNTDKISLGGIPISFIEFIHMPLNSESKEETTLLSKAFVKQIEMITCDESIKSYLLGGQYYHKMQFIDYDIQTQSISFTPKGKEIVIIDGKITGKNRQNIKVHKFFNTVLKVTKASEYDIKCFADKLISFYNDYEVKYYKNKKFAENYSRVNTRKWSTESCMDRKAENFFELYTASRFRLGVIYREGEVVGRFIEVTADLGFVYNDRLYYKDEMVVAWYNSWCDANKLHRKAYNKHDMKTQFHHVDKGIYEKTVTLTLPRHLDEYSIYPYLDTLTYGFDKKLTNIDNDAVRYKLDSQYGKCTRVRCVIDVITSKYIDNKDAIEIKFGANSGEYTTVNNLVYSVNNGGHCLK